MAYTGCCSNCEICMLVPLGCLHQGVSLLHRNLSSTKLKQAYYEAQREYVISMLGETCFESLCQAVSLSLLPETDPSYVALTSIQKTLLRQYIEPLVRLGASFMWLSFYGWDGLETPSTKDEREAIISRYEQMTYRAQGKLKKYLTDNYETLKCGQEPDDCGEPETPLYGGSWLTSTKYPDSIDMGRCDHCLDDFYPSKDCNKC